jgi:hypothetical protein
MSVKQWFFAILFGAIMFLLCGFIGGSLNPMDWSGIERAFTLLAVFLGALYGAVNGSH